MDHTYLRYECADSFGVTVASASSKAPPSNSNLAFIGTGNPLLLTTAGSYCVGFNLKSGLPVLKLGHREQLSGGLGTGRALNSGEVVCLDVSSSTSHMHTKVATGWVDGAVRVFDIDQVELTKPMGMAHSLLEENADEEFTQRDPLVLNGHGQSPVRTVCFDKGNVSRLASGGSDGTVILWDIVAETGLFRLLGHRGGITDIMYIHIPGFDGMVTSSLDGLVKAWDLEGQCCTQTIANHRGEVWGAACLQLTVKEEDDARFRLIVGGNDGQARVWSIKPPRRLSVEDDVTAEGAPPISKDDICFFMGRLVAPPNVVTSSEKILCIHFHRSGRYIGVLHANSKNVDLYLVRSTKESLKKKMRRLRRRQEKQKKKENPSNMDSASGKKRGILDDDEPSGDEEDHEDPEESIDPDLLKASDEFEYLATVRAGSKVCGFQFVPVKEKGEVLRIVCALSTNALEKHSVARKKGR
jgi:WD40 repeat protein